MRSTWITVQVLLIAAAVADGSRTGRRDADSAALKQIAKGGASFTTQIFNTIFDDKEGSLIFSPLSVQLALALLYPATAGDSAALLAKALDLPASRDDVYAGYSELMATLKHPKFKIANQIFVDETARIKDDYKKNVEKYFHAGAQTVNFKKELTKSVNFINRWVEQATNNKIRDLLPRGSMGPDTRLVLVNAIHFEAEWENKFEAHKTANLSFHVSNNKQVRVQTMHVNDYFGYRHDRNLKAKIVSLPFAGNRYKMYVVLPDEVDGLDAVVERMRAGHDVDHDALQVEFLGLSLPKFKVETDITLNEVLDKHGLGALFTSAADLSGLSNDRLSVSKVVQKAVIDVNEGGVEAAAATGITVFFKSIQPEPRTYFKADRPFLFKIHAVGQHREIPLFVGRYSGPA